MAMFRNILMLATLLLTTLVQAQGGDLQAQILYAYQTEDTHTLTNLTQNLSARVKDDPSDEALRYHLAHARYRLGELSAAHQQHRAESEFSDCIDQMKPALEKDVKSAEALALQAACYYALADLKSLEAVLLRGRAAERIKQALQLAPRNPRALYIGAAQNMARSKQDSVEHAHAFEQLRQAAQIFDETSATSIDVPGWGHAEAFLAIGRELQTRGDRVGARNWIEKSLIAAPDFKAAQRQLALLSNS